MNTYHKFCPNVWLAKCEQEYKYGDIIQVTNKYGKEADCEVHKLVAKNEKGFFYSITRCDGLNRQTYAEKKAEKYKEWAISRAKKANQWAEKATEGRDFLVLAEPIKIGHHSERRHRSLIERNNNRMDNCLSESKAADEHLRKSEYWESRKNDIDLSMPESLEYFEHLLEKAKKIHADIKNGTTEKLHSYSLPYAKKSVNDLQKKLNIAKLLWEME